ncbi:hypothetical protein [Spirosoma sp. KNUC1025]|uniref:hypothetical protein n=1 Tax=Spirosoma sp. KNUC1025 TaxID=2894082 RepID=UPI003867BEBF|nr:hypothetical protein LN737_14200 [Spirosoma sp. KNUC1025]
MNDDQQQVNQLANLFKAIGHPLRIQIVRIIAKESLVSIPTLQNALPGIDQFFIYSNLRFMHKKHLLKKLRKGREIYYGLSEKAISAGFSTFFHEQYSQNSARTDTKIAVLERAPARETPVFA